MIFRIYADARGQSSLTRSMRSVRRVTLQRMAVQRGTCLPDSDRLLGSNLEFDDPDHVGPTGSVRCTPRQSRRNDVPIAGRRGDRSEESVRLAE